MEPNTFALLVAILLFLIALLVTLLQRRYSKARFDRMLKKEDSVVTFLEGINKYLNELEWTCNIERWTEQAPQRRWAKRSMRPGIRLNGSSMT
jgi:hypothetical protein